MDLLTHYITDITLLLVDAGLALSCTWLYSRRETFQKWIYLLLAFAFSCFMVGVWPGYEMANQIGFILMTIATGAQIAAHVLVDKLEENGFDLCHGKLTDE